MSSLAELCHKEDDPFGVVDLLILQHSVIAMLEACLTSQCVKSPRHLSHTTSGVGTTSMTRVASCSRKCRSSVNLVSGKLSTDPAMKSCWAREGLTSTRETRANRSARSRLVVQECKRQADWSFFTATPPLEALRSLLVCATVEELPDDVGQPVAWTEPEVLMLIDVRWAHFYSAARSKVFVELRAGSLHGQEQSWTFAQEHVWLSRE